MDTLYLVSLLVGGFFVLLSLFGGGDTEADADFDGDFDGDFEADLDTDFDGDLDAALGSDGSFETKTDLVDLFSIRALFLFAAFFGLTGTLLSLIGSGEPYTAIVSVLTGLVVGLGGNYFIKRVGYAHVSSTVSNREMEGRTGKVVIPFEGSSRGKITLVTKGHRRQLLARAFDEESAEAFQPGEEIVVVRMHGSVAEVVKPK